MMNSHSIISQAVDLFQKNGIKKFRLISLGNSIGSGYSAVRTLKPLLLRNESLNMIMNNEIMNNTAYC